MAAVAAAIATEHRRQVEAEAIDVHVRGPVTQAVEHQCARGRIVDRDRVPAAREVLVALPSLGHQPVVTRVVDSAHRQRRPVLVALGGVVEHHVQDHLEAGLVQSAHHGLELGDRIVHGVLGCRRVPRDRVVAPVVREPLADQELLAEEGLAGHQLERGHAEAVQVIDDRRLDQPEVLAAVSDRHVRVQLREALDVQLVDDRVAPGHVRRPRVAPVEAAFDDPGLGHEGRAVLAIGYAVVVLARTAQRRVPQQPSVERERRRIDQQLGGIEAVAVARRVRAVHSIAVQRAGAAELGRQEAVPDLAGAPRQAQACALLAAGRIEQAQLDAGRIGRVDREIGALPGPVRAERLRHAGAQAHGRCSARAALWIVHDGIAVLN